MRRRWTSAASTTPSATCSTSACACDEHVLDASYYDLLASESRLLSFLAIAKGDVPRRHWSALGRPFLSVGVAAGPEVLVGLDVRVPDAGAGDARARRRPAAGGQPARPIARAAGLRRSAAACPGACPSRPTSRRTIRWPTSTRPSACRAWRCAARRRPTAWSRPMPALMAALLAPHDAVVNLRLLESLGARGEFGFFDAVDFTVSRQAEGQAFSVVRNFMAHHQGMSLVALCNLLCDEAPRRWFGSAPLVQAHDVAAARAHAAPDHRQRRSAHAARAGRRRAGAGVPAAHGRPDGAGLPAHAPAVERPLHGGAARQRRGREPLARVQRQRWRDDPLRDGYGTFFYLRDAGRPTRWPRSPPCPRRAPAGATARASWPTRCSSTRSGAGPAGAHHRADQPRGRHRAAHRRRCTTPATRRATLELISYFEPVLSQPEGRRGASGLRQPVRRDAAGSRPGARCCCRASRACTATRWWPRRTSSPRSMRSVLSVDCMADRRAFIGRNRTLADARARRAAAGRRRHADQRPRPDRLPARARCRSRPAPPRA